VVLATQKTVKPASYDYMLATSAALKNKAKAAAISDLTVRLIKAENWVKKHESTYVNDYYVNLFHLTTTEAQLILKAGGTYEYVPLNGSEKNALQNVVDLLGNAGAIPNSFNVAPLFSAAVSENYNAILKTHPQLGS
ncbi:MAG: hypothetical protein ABSA07_05505, partial [Acidimicrobiales bacterium]|jgi:sulfonate transport system substrate-binding protein